MDRIDVRGQVVRWVVLGLIAALPVTSGMHRGWPIPGLRLSELLTVAVAVVVLALAPPPRPLVRQPIVIWALVYAAATLVLGGFDVVRRGAHLGGSDLSTLVGPAQYLLLGGAVAASTARIVPRPAVLTAVLAGSIPVSLTAIAQAADVPGVRDAIAWVIGIDYTPGKGFARITGPLAHWQVLAGYLMIVLLIAAAVGSRRARRPRAPWLVVAAFLLAWTALLCTETIGVVIAASVACSVLLISPSGVRNKARWSVVAVLITALLGGGTTYARRHTQFAPDPTRPAGQRVVPETLSYRVRIWRKQYLPVVRRNWVTGYGPDLPASITWRYTESIYLRMVMRGGVLLLAVYLALMAQFGVEGARLARREEADAALGACALVLVLTLAVTQVIQPYFTDAGPAQLVWILLGLVAAAQARGARSDQGAGGPVEKSVGRPQRLEAAR